MGLLERRQPHGLSVLEPPAFLLDDEPALDLQNEDTKPDADVSLSI
jgi:hypothetical protein